METVKQSITSFICTTSILLFSAQASAIMVDLNTFTAFPPENVAISADGLSATFIEYDTYNPVSLENSGYELPADSLSLTFDYSLSVGLLEEDYFDFYLGDLSAPLYSTDGASSSGTLSFDVSASAGTFLPMVFGLASGWFDSGLSSILIISNVEIVQSGAAVPEPRSLMLFSFGLLILFFSYRNRYRFKE